MLGDGSASSELCDEQVYKGFERVDGVWGKLGKPAQCHPFEAVREYPTHYGLTGSE